MVAALVALSVLLAACGDDTGDRPELSQWQPAWEQARDLVPSDQEFRPDGDADPEVCGDFLGAVRERRNDIVPTPSAVLDDPVSEWVAMAEALGLDCDREGDLDERVEELRAQSDEIDTTIAGLT